MSDRQPTFEEELKRLEETVARLEAGGLPLAEAVALYEEGMRLIQSCTRHLDEAELHVTTVEEALAAAGRGDR